MPHRSRTSLSQLTVLHLVQPVAGGVAQVVTDLVRAQSAAGMRAVVACPPDGELAGAAGAAGAWIHPWRAGRAPGPALAGELLAAARILRAVRPQLVHAHSAKAGLVGRLTVRGRVPTVFQPHAWSFDAVTGRAHSRALLWERYGTRWATRTLCVSETERAAGERAGIAARWSVIRNGVDTDHFTPADLTEPPPRAAFAERFGIPAGAPLVVCLGRLCRQKGQDVLLTAWPRVLAEVPGARLLLVGDGPERASLDRAAPPGVHLTGAVADPRPALRAADLVVLPSRWEGMALAPLEAMACGTPVVVTDVSGAREALPAGHDTHALVPPEDPGALAAALIALLTDAPLRATLGDQARAHVRATADIRQTAAAVLGLYRDLLGPSPFLTSHRPRRSATP
ncbi:glycosyltransferase family 4 protein [Streptomyces sp. NPDC057638]|uniref:glycosyltransferase family 4 protein n=1 Tax=Streptomyces sp. NPDC057638 TaxID=3346190 RepID=UPI003685D2D6